MRRLLSLLLALLLVPLAGGTAQAAPTQRLPARIDLPTGFQPEGIEAGAGTTVYVGSLADGSIWRGDVRTGRGHVWAAPVGSSTVGLTYDPQRGLLWAAGGPSGQVRAYNTATGALVRTYTVPGSGFLNDLTVMDSGVYVTDSMVQRLVVVPFGAGGGLPAMATTLPITGDLVFGPGFNANGIVNAQGFLLVVNSATGLLFRVNPSTGRSVQVDTGDLRLVNGDGLQLRGRTLYVVRNQNNIVVRLHLAPALLHAWRTDTLRGDTDVPTTATFAAGHLYVVNARFLATGADTAAYWITRLT